MVWKWHNLFILISKYTSHHNDVHFFDISSAKSSPHVVCFTYFDLEMFFVPRRRTLYFQKWSEYDVFRTFWFRNLLRVTAAYIFSTSQVPKIVRTWYILSILIWKYISYHNDVYFTSKSGPNMMYFVDFELKICFTSQQHIIFYFSSGQMVPHPPL